MAWRSSFGATVLLALVALHASALIASSEQVQLNENRDSDIPSRTEQVRSMLEEMLGSGRFTISTPNEHYSWREMINLWQKDETRCADGFFSLLERWAIKADKTIKNDLLDAIETWKETCYSRLEDKIQFELNTMNKLTREHFELFAKQDQHECKSEGRSECLSFGCSNLVIGKLRRLIGSPEGAPSADQLEAAERSVSACKEIAASDSIKTTRTQYQKLTPSSTEPHFPHIRFYDYCKQLLNLAQVIDSRLGSAPLLERFGEELDKIRGRTLSKAESYRMSSETAESESEQKRSVAEAAVRFAEWAHPRPLRDEDEKLLTLQNELNRLKNTCSYWLHALENMIWMHKNMYDLLGRERWGRQKPETERKLNFLDACKQLVELKNDEIIEAAKQKAGKMFPNV
jgi:hypothetical protein